MDKLLKSSCFQIQAFRYGDLMKQKCLLLERKSKKTLYKILRCRDMMATRVYIVKTVIFPVVTNSSENSNTRNVEEKSIPFNGSVGENCYEYLGLKEQIVH